MGLLLGKLLSSISWGTKDYGILMIGLDNAPDDGERVWAHEEDNNFVQNENGRACDDDSYNRVQRGINKVPERELHSVGCGGQDRIWPLWRHYFDNIQGLIFVVDSNDKERILEARDELHKLLKNSEVSNAKLMVFANKQDLAKVLTTKEVTDRLHLSQVEAKQGVARASLQCHHREGLREGLDWLAAGLNDSPGKTTNNTYET